MGGTFNVSIDNHPRQLEISSNSEFFINQIIDNLESPIIPPNLLKFKNIQFIENNNNGNITYSMKCVESVKYIDQFYEMKPLRVKTNSNDSSRSYIISWIEDSKNMDNDNDNNKSIIQTYNETIESFKHNLLKMKITFFDCETEEVLYSHLTRWKKIKHSQIDQIKRLFSLSQITFDEKNKEHEDLLFKLWELSFSSTHGISRVSDKWKLIGFQYNDPVSDFRGMGILGLINLIYIMENYKEHCQRVLSLNRDYPFASIGINISSTVFSFLKVSANKLKVPSSSPSWSSDLLNFMCYCRLQKNDKLDSIKSIERFSNFTFNEVYCHTMFIFDKIWESTKATYMDTPNVLFATKVRMKKILKRRPKSIEQFKAFVDQELISI